jgi:CheY-like chemotaxis protein
METSFLPARTAGGAIRARDAKVILVAISAYGQADDRQRALEAGFDAHLTKPVAPDHLLAALARLTGRTDAR